MLDSSQGKPASGVKVSLQILRAELSGSNEAKDKILAEGCVSFFGDEIRSFGTDILIHNRTTDTDGRCSTLLSPNEKLSSGIYKMVFFTGDYFKATGKETFYPVVEVGL